MKKLVLTLVVCMSLTLFSFTNSTEAGVQMIGRDLYKVDTSARFSSEDQNLITKTIQKQYNISDVALREAYANGGMTLQAQSRNWIVDTKINRDFIDTKAIVWNATRLTEAEAAEARVLSARIATYLN